MLTDLSRDHIRKMRAIGPAGDPLALRRAAERALAAASIHPRSVPAGAIVCVRRVRIAAPARGGAGLAASLDRALEALVPAMVRPFGGAVPAGAAAVVFLDHAELLACLARDMLRGDGDSWWWRSLLGAPAGEAIVRREFAQAPRAVPQAVELLDRARLAADFARALPPDFCRRLAAEVAETFAVPQWTAESSASSASGGHRADPASAIGADLAARVRAALGDSSVRATLAAASPAAREFVGLALAIRRTPALVRRADFATALREALTATPPTIAPARRLDAATAATAADPTTRGEEPAGRTRLADVRERENETSADPPRRSAAGAAAGRAPRPAPEIPGVAPAGRRAAQDARVCLPAETAEAAPPLESRDVERAPAPPVSADRRSSSPDAAPESVHRIESDFAGVVHVVNLALHLEIYGDFTQPARPGIALPVGDFVALVGERACGPAIRADPVWELLAALSGREADEPPGAGFEVPDGVPLERWTGDLAARLEARAALALGPTEGGALPFLCRRPGRLALSSSRLTATFQLAGHPLAIRIAGLDRDPGWVPAAGRVIEYVYE